MAKEEKAAAKESAKSSDSSLMAALSYLINLLGLPFSLILYLMKKEDKFVRFHSLQATIFWVAGLVVGVGFVVVMTVLTIATGGLAGILGLCILPLGLALFVVDLYAAYKAYQGEMWEIPVLGSFTKKYI